MPGGVCFGVRFAGVRVELSGVPPSALRRLRRAFPEPNAPCAHPGPAANRVRIDVMRSPCAGGARYRVRGDGSPSAWADDDGALAASLEHEIVRAVATRTDRHVVLHAAAVADAAGVTLLAGVGGAGKSSLCRALVRSGWNYLSDELGLVRCDTLVVEPFLRAILIKPVPASRAALSERTGEVRRSPTLDDGRRYEDWRKVRVGSQGGSGPLARVLLCEWRPGSKLQMHQCGSRRALHRLAALNMNAGTLGTRMAWPTLARISDTVPVTALVYGDAVAAATRLTDMGRGVDE